MGLGLPCSLLAVSSPACFNTEAAILKENLLWKLFNIFSFKGSNLSLLFGFLSPGLRLSFWHLVEGTRGNPTARGALVRLHQWSYKSFTSSHGHAVLFGGGQAGHDLLQPLPPSSGPQLLPASHASPAQPDDICAICRECLPRPGGWK